MFVPEHLARAVRFSHAWIGQCPCGWLGSDQHDEVDAAREAEMHERGERPPWAPERFEEWTPERHPTPDE